MKNSRQVAVWTYVVNASLLTAHEIDSAYWHEWELFGLPGGIQLFVVVNLVLLLIVFYGLTRVVRWRAWAKAFSYFLAGAGIFAFVVHAYLILLGHPQFRAPVSQGLLVAALLVSVAQIVIVRRA